MVLNLCSFLSSVQLDFILAKKEKKGGVMEGGEGGGKGYLGTFAVIRGKLQ